MSTEKKFNFWLPATISKSVDEKTGVEEMFLEGVASDPTKDIEGDTMNPKGFDTNYFMKNGMLKWEHGKDPSSYIGEPISAKITRNNEFFIKGKLWGDSKTARDTYELAKILEKSGSKRRIGWSIEGNATELNPSNEKDIRKASITNVVLTMNPVNSNTWASIVKGKNKDLFIPNQYEKEEDLCTGKACLLDIEHEGTRFQLDQEFNLIKSATSKLMKVKKMGLSELIKEHENLINVLENGSPEEIEVEIKKQKGELKEYRSDIEKTMTTTSGATLTKEDVEGSEKNLENKPSICIQKSVAVLVNAVNLGILPEKELEKIKEKLNS